MTRDECIAEIQEGLGFRKDMQVNIARKLEEAQRKLETGKSLPDFLINKDSPVAILLGVDEYPLSDAFIREIEDLGQQYPATNVQGDIYHVRRMDYDEAIARFGFTGTGYPSVYAIRARVLRFFPIPDAAYAYRWSFYQHQTTLASGNVTADQNAWLRYRPYLLIGHAGFAQAKNLRDVAAMKHFSDMVMEWQDMDTREKAQDTESNNPTIMGVNS